MPLLQVAAVLLQRARKAEHLDRPRAVLDRDIGHEGVFLRHLRLARGDNARERNFLPVGERRRAGFLRKVLHHAANGRRAGRTDKRTVGVHRVTRKVEPRRRFFHRHQLLRRELGNVRQDKSRLPRRFRTHAKKVDLPLHIDAIALGNAVHHLLIDGDELRALCTRRVERARANEILDRALVDLHAVHAAAEILKIDKRPIQLALAHHAQDQPTSDVLDGNETEANTFGLDREAISGVIDVRRQELNAALAALGEVFAHLVGRVEYAR